MLRVDDGRAGGSFTSRNCANPSPQYLLHPFPGAVISPAAEVPPDRAPGRQATRHPALGGPGHAAPQHVENALTTSLEFVVLGWPLVGWDSAV